MPDTVEDIDEDLLRWRMKARAARFDNSPGDLLEAETAINDLLDLRNALVLA